MSTTSTARLHWGAVRRPSLAGGLALSVLATASAAAQTSARPGEPPRLTDGSEVLRQADVKLRAVKRVRYDAVLTPIGWHADGWPTITGNVILAGGSDKGLDRYRMELKFKPPAADEFELTLCCDGTLIFVIDHKNKVFRTLRQERDLGSLSGVPRALGVLEFVHPAPLNDEIRGERILFNGVQKVGAEDCYDVFVKYRDDAHEVQWWFALADLLPRRVERIEYHSTTGQRGALRLDLSNIAPNLKFDENPFRIPVPEGYRESTEPIP